MTATIPQVIAPVPEQNEIDQGALVTNQAIATEILDMHVAGLEVRRGHDLLSEKLLLHIDSGGDLAYAEIYDNTRIVIPEMVAEYKKTDNLLRLVVDNAVAHHTSTPFKFFADSPPDRVSREKALMDSLWINYVSWQQDLNGLAADALYMAMSSGFCPIHAYWSENQVEQHEPISHSVVEGPEAQLQQLFDPQPGRLDLWLGNPFDHVFDNAAKRGSIHWSSYGRVLPADPVRQTFGHMPGVMDLQGTTRIPSASQWQRIASKWNLEGIGRQGSPILSDTSSNKNTEELMTVICREVLPGYEMAWPRGRLQIIAVPEMADREHRHQTSQPVLLYDGDLPAGDFSFQNFYSHHRSDDVLGKPWIEDMDVNQVDLNIALSEYWEYLQKMKNTPMVTPGGAIESDMGNLNGYDILEIDQSLGSWTPRVPQWPTEVLTGLEKVIKDKRDSIWRGGGYQAASRGESAGTRQAAKAIMALQVADNSIHAPVNMRFRRSMTQFARNQCWKPMKTYGDVGWMVDIVGDEYEYMVEPYIDRTKLSDEPPSYKMVNAFGPSPELRAQEMLELGQVRTADGLPLLTNQEVRDGYPHQEIFHARGNPQIVARRRARTIASETNRAAEGFRQKTGFDEWGVQDPAVLEAGKIVAMMIYQQFPPMRTDDLQAHLDTGTEIVQDETADPVARNAAQRRLDIYFAWQAEMAAAQMPAPNALPPGTAPQRQTASVSTEMARSGEGVVLG